MKHFFLISDYKRGSGKSTGNEVPLFVPAGVVKTIDVYERKINEGGEFLDDNVRTKEQALDINGLDDSAAWNKKR